MEDEKQVTAPEELAEPIEEPVEQERRGPGRPRIHPEGYRKPYKSRVNPSNPKSVAAAVAGRAAQQTRQSKEQSEYWRRRKGHEQQEILDQAIANLNQELETYNYGHSLDKQDTKEFAAICVTIIQDCIWQRQYPIDSDNFYDEIETPAEDKKFCCGWIDLYMHDVLVMASYTLHPDRPLLQKLAVETAEKFLLWAKTQKSPDVQVAATETNALLGQLQNGKIYRGLITPDPRLTPPEQPRPVADILAERESWSRLGRDSSPIRRPNIEEEQLRLAQEMETAILEEKAEQARQEQERHLQTLPSDALNYLQSGFGALRRR